MILLKNIAASTIFYNLEENLKNLIRRNGCYSIADVIELMEKYPDYNWKQVRYRISNIERVINNGNEKGYVYEIYPYGNYSDKTLEYNDKLNYGDILLLANPTHEIQIRYREIRPYSIDCIKRSLQLTDEYGRNVIRRLKNFGPDSLPKIINALKMYDEQIERQASLTNERDINLFTKDKDSKKEIVEDMYSDIIMYLISSPEEKTIWGELSDSKKTKYFSSITNNKKIDKIIKERMIDIVSDYTTLPELEEVANGNQKVLRRFIEK